MSAELLPSAQLLQRYSISHSALYRWANDPTLNMPKPALVIAKRKYWRLADLEAWEASLPTETGLTPPKPARAA